MTMRRDVNYFDREIEGIKEKIKYEELGMGCVAISLALLIGAICGAIPAFLLPGFGIVIGIVVFIIFMLAFFFNVARGKKHVEDLKKQIIELEQGKQATIMYNAKVEIQREGGQASGESAPPPPAPTGLFSVRIVGLPDNRQAAIETLQGELALDLPRAVVLVDTVPSIALERVAHDAAEMTTRRLRKHGFLVEVISA